MNDVIVVIPGIMGSTLHRNGAPIWDASICAVKRNLKPLLGAVKDLRLTNGVGDELPSDGVTAESLIPDIRAPLGLWTFDLGYTKLVDFLRLTFETNSDPAVGPRNLIEFPYDWRLSNRYNGERLRQIEGVLDEWRAQGGDCADGKLVFICHSMGGLIARWYVDKCDGAAHTRSVITVGTPHRGALAALDQLVNGVEKGIGPLKADLTLLGRSLPSLHQLLPEYACLNGGTGLLRTTETTLPELDTQMVNDGMRFHNQLDAARLTNGSAYELHALGGHKQPTPTTATIAGNRARIDRSIAGSDEGGDATVPRLSFAPPDVTPTSATLHYFADNHAGLVHNRALFDHIEGILTARNIVHRSPLRELSVEVPETLEADEDLVVTAEVAAETDSPIEAVVTDGSGKAIGEPRRLMASGEGRVARVHLPSPGVYAVTVRGTGRAGAMIQPVTTIIQSFPKEDLLDRSGW